MRSGFYLGGSSRAPTLGFTEPTPTAACYHLERIGAPRLAVERQRRDGWQAMCDRLRAAHTKSTSTTPPPYNTAAVGGSLPPTTPPCERTED